MSNTEARGPWLSQHPPVMTWRPRAACLGKGTDAFFGKGAKSSPDEAPAICQSCPVRRQCLEHGLRYEEHGTWGGIPQHKLQAMRKARGIRLPRF